MIWMDDVLQVPVSRGYLAKLSGGIISASLAAAHEQLKQAIPRGLAAQRASDITNGCGPQLPPAANRAEASSNSSTNRSLRSLSGGEPPPLLACVSSNLDAPAAGGIIVGSLEISMDYARSGSKSKSKNGNQWSYAVNG